MRFICKNCGAESPHGIGYVGPDDGPLPEAEPDCPNPHVGRLRRELGITKAKRANATTTEHEEHQP